MITIYTELRGKILRRLQGPCNLQGTWGLDTPYLFLKGTPLHLSFLLGAAEDDQHCYMHVSNEGGNLSPELDGFVIVDSKGDPILQIKGDEPFKCEALRILEGFEIKGPDGRPLEGEWKPIKWDTEASQLIA